MQQLGQYVVSLTTIAILSGILLSFLSEGTIRSLVQLVCGVFLTLTALSPLEEFVMPNVEQYIESCKEEGDMLAADAEAYAKKQWLQRIKLSVESYILDKAANEGASIKAEATLNAEGIPVSVLLCGRFSPDQQKKLKAEITKDLGIPEEDQQWIEEN